MAGERKITVTFDGKDVGLGSAVDRVSSDLDEVERSTRSASEGFDALGEGADTGEQRLIGVADTITGTQDVMQGFSDFSKGDMVGGLLGMTMGFADLASGISNLIAPFAAQVTGWITGRTAMATADATGAAVSTTSWISMAATSLASAAQVALAWLISVGPILIVIAIIVGLVVLIIKNWDTIKAVIAAGWNFIKDLTSRVWGAISSVVSGQINAISSAVSAVWNGIKSVTSAVWGAITGTIQSQISAITGVFNSFRSTVSSIFSAVANAITAPIRSALDGVRSAWNNTIGGKGISIPKVLGFGGASFTIPKLASGGLAFAPTLAIVGDNAGAARDPEVIAPLSKLRAMLGGTGGGDMVHVQVVIDNQVLIDAVRKGVRNRGGSVESVLGR